MDGSRDNPIRGAKAYVRRLESWTSKFRDATILVIGDLIVDEYIMGEVERISPEAPVPVVKVSNRDLRLGGAANVVNNLRALGAKVLTCGIVGEDEQGAWLTGKLRSRGIPVCGIIRDPKRPSTLKTRIVAHNQQVVRIDREETLPVGAEQLERICAYVRKQAPRTNGVIISDYGKGVVDEAVMEEVRAIARNHPLVVSVDPKENHFSLYKDVTAVTPNHLEASRAAGIELSSEQSLVEVGRRLLRALRCQMLLITRGEEGMSLFLGDGDHLHIPTVAREVFDVTGAGDTVISAFTLGLAVGAGPLEAALLSNLAAGIVVGEVGTATVSNRRLRKVLRGVERI